MAQQDKNYVVGFKNIGGEESKCCVCLANDAFYVSTQEVNYVVLAKFTGFIKDKKVNDAFLAVIEFLLYREYELFFETSLYPIEELYVSYYPRSFVDAHPGLFEEPKGRDGSFPRWSFDGEPLDPPDTFKKTYYQNLHDPDTGRIIGQYRIDLYLEEGTGRMSLSIWNK